MGKWWTEHGTDIWKSALGSLIGAMLAFASERYFRNYEVSQRNLEAGLLTLATLEDMESVLFANYCLNVHPFKNSKRAWLDLGSNPGDFPTVQSLNPPSLSFLLPEAGSQIYDQISAAGSAYAEYAALVSRRNRQLFEVIYPATLPLEKERNSREFDKKVLDAIGSGPVEQAHQSALAMLNTRGFMNVVFEARSSIHRALKEQFDDDVPTLRASMWPADEGSPDCFKVQREEGTFGRVRLPPARTAPNR